MKELLVENAKIIEKSKTRVLVEFEDSGKTKQKVAKYAGQKEIGQNVSLFKVLKGKIWHILFLLIPAFCVIVGFGAGFAFSNNLFQYILSALLGVVSFVIVAICEKFFMKKQIYDIICE